FLVSTKGLAKDEEVQAKAQAIIDEVDAKYGAVFATTEVLLNGAKAPGNRTEETNLGDLITDAMVWSVVKEGGIEQVEPNQVVGITNGGGIRATIDVGDVTMKDINTVLPFGNTVAVIYVTGAELLEAMEASTFCTPDAVGGYPQTSGIEWTLDTTKAYDQGAVYTLDGKESSYFAPASINRVTITAVNGEPFDIDAVYAVITNNFCAAGGDTYNAFARAYSEGAGFDTGIPMDEAVMAFVTEVLEGKITAEAYGEPRGSQTQIR
ncbi:MAG: 5'-nucleotidase C-terminal domain-containing protein, partial [Clostridia bacterium]|nr:5'-nucleotidase C-terminal domain-containing protein [Clostridia bacterium]